jgi:tetratricopeptide (TPR) repeat protein
MKTEAMFAAAFALCLASAGPAFSDGGDSNQSMTTCGKGEVWDSRTKKCVRASSSLLPDEMLTENAYALAKAERYDEALAVLDLLKNPDTATALNYRGYATRKLGRTDEGIQYYLKSVARDPRYAKVREYLGEAYVIKGDIASAQAQLATIEQICGTSCEEYKDLAEAIANQSKS